MSDDQWAVPGVPRSRPDVAPAADVVSLAAAVDGALAADPALLAPQEAVARAERLLSVQERLAAAVLKAVADVDVRELWRERAAGSTRTWLRTLPCGDGGQLAAARLLADRPVLAGALADGDLSVRTAVAVGRELARVPAHVEAEQLEAVLVDGLGDLLGVWAGAACLDPAPAQQAEFDARRDELAAAVRTGLADCWTDAAGQLEPAFVLAARVLAPAEVVAGLGVLVDALQPVADVEALAEEEHRSRGLVLRRLKRGGWSLRAHLTDEAGQLLHEELAARLSDRARRAAAHEPSERSGVQDADRLFLAASEGEEVDARDDDALDDDALDDDALGDDAALGDEARDDQLARHGTAGAGSPLDLADLADPAVQGTPVASTDQLWHDALLRLLGDLAGVAPGSGAPAPAQLTVVAPLAALEGRPGAPPGLLRTGRTEVALTPSQLRRHACGSQLSAVLVDAQRRPVAASGQHRHATARERRALRVAWGRTCAVNGCGLSGEVPHHAEPFWKSGETVLRDLVPICRHHHHDVHEGHKTLRLRDGRLLDEWGWVTPDRAAHRDAG